MSEAKCTCSVVRHRTQITDDAIRERWICERCGAEFTRDTFEDVREWSREQGRRAEKALGDLMHAEAEIAKKDAQLAALHGALREYRRETEYADNTGWVYAHLYGPPKPPRLRRRRARPSPNPRPATPRPAVDPREEE